MARIVSRLTLDEVHAVSVTLNSDLYLYEEEA